MHYVAHILCCVAANVEYTLGASAMKKQPGVSSAKTSVCFCFSFQGAVALPLRSDPELPK